MTKMIKRKGVTLIELLIVVLILAALAAIAIPRISSSATAAKKNACKTNIDVMNSAIEMYAADHSGTYPADLEVVTKSTTYFPSGEPTCPVTGAVYPKALSASNRVVETAHGDAH
jgi:general secretion pathway protein G